MNPVEKVGTDFVVNNYSDMLKLMKSINQPGHSNEFQQIEEYIDEVKGKVIDVKI